MIARHLSDLLQQRLRETPAVVLLGPRQAGKTTLALEIAQALPALYFDLESPRDQARLIEPELYLPDLFDRLVILDEVHRAPGLFPVLRGLIDRARRQGHRQGLYLLLGSASLELLQQSGESLAGRVSHLELTPFTSTEIDDAESLWLRGGFPESFLADGDGPSMRWREDFVLTYLERDIPQFGPRIAVETLRRFWTMLAHHQGQPLNLAQLARNLGVDGKTAARYVDLLVDLLLVRRLPPWHANVGKRLVRTPRVYVRDSGLLHALLGLGDMHALLAHPVVGASWEAFVIEQLLAAAPNQVQGYFYRTSGGAEIDLLLVWPDNTKWAIEIKRSLSPTLERGFHAACADLEPQVRFVVYPGSTAYPVRDDVTATPLADLVGRLASGEPTR